MIARRHMHDFGTTREHLAAVAVKNHENGALNPDAHMRKVITLEQALKARPIAEPLGLYDCSLISDGAAAVIVTAAERAGDLRKAGAGAGDGAGVRLRGARSEGRHHDVSRRCRRAAKKAYAMAGLGPDDIQFAELHDCFTIAEIIATEDLGFVGTGPGRPVRGGGLHAPWRNDAGERERRIEVEGAPGGRDRRGADRGRRAAASRRGRGAAIGAARDRAGAEPGRIGSDLRGQHPGGGL